jgi:histone deacetylase 1/2
LQEAEIHSEDSDDSDNYRWNSDDSLVSSLRRRRYAQKPYKKRMSIITNQHFDIPSYENGFEYAIPGKPESRRRFFQTVARWDAKLGRVVIPGLKMPQQAQYRSRPLKASVIRTPRYSDDDLPVDRDGEEEESTIEGDDDGMDVSNTESRDDEDEDISPV